MVGGTVTIAGAGAATTIDANGIDRVLDVLPGATLTLQNLTITGGKLPIASTGPPAGNGSAGNPGLDGGDSRAGAGTPGRAAAGCVAPAR